MRNEVAKKYSQALLELGREQATLSRLREELNEFWEIINKHEELIQVLNHQRILPEEKKKVLKEIFTDQLSGQTLNFLFLLIDKRREYFLESIIKDFNALVNAEEEIIEVEVVSAVELSDEQRTGLKEKLDKILDYNEIIIKDRYNPEILGGLIIKVGDYILDGSLKKQLESLEEEIDRIPVSELGV